jgi:hypothetical protein
MVDVGVLYLFCNAKAAASHSQLLSLCHDNWKIVLSGRKLIHDLPKPAFRNAGM